MHKIICPTTSLRFKSWFWVIVTTALFVTAVTACGSPTPTPAVTFDITIPSDVTTANVWSIIGPNSTAYNQAVFLNRYPSLMNYSDQRFDWIPRMANGFPSSPMEEGSGWTVTAKIKPGLQWSDGEAMDAHDLVFTLSTAKDLNLPGGWKENINYDVLDRVEAIDSLTVKYYFNERPGLAVWQYGAALAYVVPEHYWAPIVANLKSEFPGSNSDTQALLNNALFEYTPDGEPSGGPYTFNKWEPGAFIDLARNNLFSWDGTSVTEYSSGAYTETYADSTFVGYGDASGDVTLELERNPSAENVLFNVSSSQDAAILSLVDGETDYFLSPLGLAQGLRAQVQNRDGVTTVQNPTNGFRYLGFNFNRAPMNDKAFRKALEILIDKELLTNRILQGAADPIYTFVPKGNFAWHNANIAKVGSGLSRQMRVEEAVTILKAAGYSWTFEPTWDEGNLRVIPGDGLAGPDGTPIPPLEVLSPGNSYDPLRATAAIWLERWFQEVGIPVRAKLTGFNEIVDKVFVSPDKDFDMWILGWGLTPFGDHLADFFSEEQAEVGGNNGGQWIDSGYGQLIDEFTRETDLNEALNLAFRMQEYLADELPYIVLFGTPIYEAYRSGRVEFPYTSTLDGLQQQFQGLAGLLSTTTFQ